MMQDWTLVLVVVDHSEEEVTMFFLALGLVLGLSQVQAHTYHLGDCPNVEPMSNFDMEKFLGKWYVIQKTSTGSGCLVNNYTKDAENPGQFKIEQISEHFLLGLTSYDHKYHYTGDLSVPSREFPGAMRVVFPLNVVGGATYTVFMTDYESYAGVFTCQKLAFAHRQSATILSRTPTLQKAYLDKIRSRLSSLGVDPHDLSIVRQVNCTVPDQNTSNFGIDGDTFSTGKVTTAVKNFGVKIEEGAEAIGEHAKKVYQKVRGEDSEEDTKGERNVNLDAEWLP